jgi:hypothetical protein
MEVVVVGETLVQPVLLVQEDLLVILDLRVLQVQME